MAAKSKTDNFHRGTGRRKTSVARVRVYEGNGQFTINGREVDDYFSENKDRDWVRGPLSITGLTSRLDVIADVHGGGFTGQAGAVSQGLARAIKNMFTGTEEGEGKPEPEQPATPLIETDGETEEAAESEKTPEEGEAPSTEPSGGGGGFIRKLRDAGYLTRDSRMKERKKPGQKGARKSFQFSKR